MRHLLAAVLRRIAEVIEPAPPIIVTFDVEDYRALVHDALVGEIQRTAEVN